MSLNIVIIVLVVAAAVAFVAWNRRSKARDVSAASPAYAPPASRPVASGTASNSGTGAPVASYEEYRRVSPSNMLNGKLTCNRCGSNLIRTAGGTASCTSCGAALYRA